MPARVPPHIKSAQEGVFSVPCCGTIANQSKRGSGMNRKQFANIRHRLGKTQSQMAQLLGTSLKSIQSFEQGWRNIPVHTERQVLLLLALKTLPSRKDRPCWVTRNCRREVRQECPAWEFHAGHLCCFINGTICQGKMQGSWQKKMKICRECEVFKRMLPEL
jgi:DNA-binding XRE family transcriptional regulator